MDPNLPAPPPNAGPPPGPPAAPPAPPAASTGAPWAPAPTSGWAPPSEPARSSRRRWVIGCLVLVVLLVIAIGGCTVLVFRSLGDGFSVIAGSGGQIETFNVVSANGVTRITFQGARGIDTEDGPRLACDVIKPILARSSDLRGAQWILVNRAGDVIASDDTSCGP